MKGNDYKDQDTCLYCDYFDDNRSYNDVIEYAKCWCMRGMSDHEERLASADMFGLERLAKELGRTSNFLKEERNSLRELHQIYPSGVCEYYNDAD